MKKTDLVFGKQGFELSDLKMREPQHYTPQERALIKALKVALCDFYPMAQTKAARHSMNHRFLAKEAIERRAQLCTVTNPIGICIKKSRNGFLDKNLEV